MCSRSYYVGRQLKEEDIKANFKNGILTIEFPKVEKKSEKEIYSNRRIKKTLNKM